MILLLFLIAVVPALAGEVGLRLEGPAPAGTLWLSYAGGGEGWSLLGRAEGDLFPLGFRRGAARVAWDLAPFSFSADLVLLGSGRTDLFFGSSGEISKPWSRLHLKVQGGMKAGWIGVNTAPLWILSSWAFFSLDSEHFSATLGLDGPSPWQGNLQLRLASLALNLGSVVALGAGWESPPWSAEFSLQIWPRPVQTHVLRWSLGNRRFQILLDSAGQLRAQFSSAKGGGRASVFLSFSFVRSIQMALELVWEL